VFSIYSGRPFTRRGSKEPGINRTITGRDPEDNRERTGVQPPSKIENEAPTKNFQRQDVE